MDLAKSSIHVIERDVLALESKIGCQIPEPYRSFLQNTNGGKIASGPDCFYFSSYRGDDGSFIRYFLRLLPEDSIRTVFDVWLDQHDEYPVNMIPIAQDGFGNAVLLGLVNPHRGEIFFWYHDLGNDDPWENTFLVARSFDDFVNSLQSG